VRQFGRFALVGVGNTVLSLVVYALLATAGLPPAAAGATAFCAGAVNGYLLNRRWTFRARDSSGSRARYLVVQAAGAATTSLLAWALATDGYLVALPLVTAATFVANRRWTFLVAATAKPATAPERLGRALPDPAGHAQNPSCEPYALR
jgi:putative flippase GtrA